MTFSRTTLVYFFAGYLILQIVAFPQGFNNNNDVDDQDEDDTNSTEVTTPRYEVGQRIQDYFGGLQDILKGTATGNIKGILEGSVNFIPPPFRGGVGDVLGAVIGTPFKNNSNSTRIALSTSTESPASPTTAERDPIIEDINSVASLNNLPVADNTKPTTTTTIATEAPANATTAKLVVQTTIDTKTQDNDDESEEEGDNDSK